MSPSDPPTSIKRRKQEGIRFDNPLRIDNCRAKRGLQRRQREINDASIDERETGA
jgi:hypothetical protein